MTLTAEPVRFERQVLSGDAITADVELAALAILEAAFPRWPPFEVPASPLEHLRWKLEHPGWAPSSLVAERVEGEIAGVTIRLHRRFRVQGTTRLARDWVDHCLHPAHQATGVYRLLASTWREQRAEYDLGVWSTAHPKVRHAARRSESGLVELGARIGTWVLPLAPARALARRGDPGVPAWRRTLLAAAAVAVARACRRLPPSRRPAAEPAVAEATRFDERFGQLAEAAAGHVGWIQERSPELLAWRYLDPRGGRFVVLAALEASGTLAGFAALKIADGLGYLADLVTLPGEAAAEAALIDAAVDRAGAAGVDAVVCRAVAAPSLRRALARRGFIRSRIRTGYAVSSGRLGLDRLRFLESPATRIHLMLGDVDWA